MYLYNLIERLMDAYPDFEAKGKEQYDKDFVFDIDMSVRDNREWVKRRNKEIYKENYDARRLKDKQIETILHTIRLAVAENEMYLNYHSTNNLINYCLNKLGRNERKLQKWANVKALVDEIEYKLEDLRSIFC